MAGMLFFLLLAASRVRGAEGYDDEWSFPEEDAYDMMSADDHLLSQRMLRKMTSARPVYGHEKAARIHDSVTIVVNETTSSDISSSNDLKRDSSNNMNLTNWLTPSLGSMKLTQRGEEANGNTPTLSYNTARSHKSDSTIERTQNFSTTLTGEVVEVLPNRYLVVQARKSVEINGETQTVIVTGTVNPDHLDSNSSIKAEQVMDMSVRYSGNGPMTRMDRRGWGSKIIDFINPF
jgi:flagellar basal body L-ring protein FlgH